MKLFLLTISVAGLLPLGPLRADESLELLAATVGTRPLIFSGNKPVNNFSTSAAGSIRDQVQTAEGKPIPGFSLFECREQIGNEIERQVT